MTLGISAHSALFENQPIRRVFDEATETWWFSVVDIVRVLTQQPDATVARKYWNKLKQRLHEEGSQLVTNCHQLKLPASDGKKPSTRCGDRRDAAAADSDSSAPVTGMALGVGHSYDLNLVQ